jgi:hypothetical protein
MRISGLGSSAAEGQRTQLMKTGTNDGRKLARESTESGTKTEG